MPLSEQTIAEMRAGAATVAAHAGQHGIDEAYMEAMIRTQQRAKWLIALEKEGKLQIERQVRYHTSVKDGLAARTVVHVGDNQFTDESAELTGAFPSEVLVAQVAMALMAGEDKGPPQDTVPVGVAWYNPRSDQTLQRVRVVDPQDPSKSVVVTKVLHNGK